MNPLKTKPGELAPDDKRITRKEARDLLTALDKPEFGGLMDDYIKEISNPNNIKETNQFLKESEEKKDLPANVKLAKPKEGFCIRSEKYNIKRPSQRKKVFINIVSLEDVQEPQNDNNNMWKLPYLLNPGRHDQDKKGKYCTTYDVVFNPKAIELANGNLAFKKFVCDTAIEGINNQILAKEEEKISKDFVMKKFNYKGLEVSYVNVHTLNKGEMDDRKEPSEFHKTQVMKEVEKLKAEQDKKKKELAELDNQNTKKDNEISQLKQEIAIKKKEISNYQNKNKAYSQFLSKLNSESAPSQSTEQINEQEINTESNINNENNENHSQENLNIEQYQNEPLSPEKLKFLIEKFDSKAYERSYIVKCLQKDLEDYQLYIQSELEAKREKINDIITQLQSVVNEIDSNYTVRLYGSYSTGLCLPWSDIDTVIESNDGKYDPNFLNKLNGKLAHKDWVKEQNYIDRATIPIIKLISKDEYNFHIDISMSSENHFGLKTVTLVNEYLKEYKVLKPIILALKTLLKNGNLNDPYKGGLSSYGLILMVVSFIQSEIDSDKYNENSPTLIGETFLNVLGHYGIFFDYNNYVIITYPIRAKNYPNEKELTYQFIPNTHELIIVDPLNKTNNVAKSTFQFMNIKMGFLIAFMVAKEDCECGCHYEYLKNSRDMEHGHCILKRIFNSIKRFKDANKNIY